jgi:hypothetical protein
MIGERKTAATVGALFIVATVAGGLSVALLGSILDASDLLASVRANGSQVLISPVKEWQGRPKPPLSLVKLTRYSSPSGYAVAGAPIASVIVLVPADPRRKNLEMTN